MKNFFETTVNAIKKLVVKFCIRYISKCFGIPLFYKNNFYLISKFPLTSDQYLLQSDFLDLKNKIAILIQGDIMSKHNFTYETCKIYQKIFNSPNIEIILSTWNDENLDRIKKIQDLGIKVLTWDKPFNPKNIYRSNLNLQICSTLSGIKFAKSIGCEYILKTRSDQRFYATNILETLLNLQKTFPLNIKNTKLQNRLIACSFNTFKHRIHGISDMFLFGNIQDVYQYWNIPYDKNEYNDEITDDEFIKFQKYCSETYIMTKFLKNIDENFLYTIEDSNRIIASLFCLLDAQSLNLYWPKYSNFDFNSRFFSFSSNKMEPLLFKDWLNIYYQYNNKTCSH